MKDDSFWQTSWSDGISYFQFTNIYSYSLFIWPHSLHIWIQIIWIVRMKWVCACSPINKLEREALARLRWLSSVCTSVLQVGNTLALLPGLRCLKFVIEKHHYRESMFCLKLQICIFTQPYLELGWVVLTDSNKSVKCGAKWCWHPSY